jgi:glycerophosphoryl diester phosphodiesterase
MTMNSPPPMLNMGGVYRRAPAGPFALGRTVASWHTRLVPARLPSLLRPPIGFAHRGARAHAPENTLEAFSLAARLGATGLESDVWRTADGEAVLDHDGVVRMGLRRRPISELRRNQLPDHIPTLGELYDTVGTHLPLSLDVKDSQAFDATVAAARSAGGDAVEHLWLCHYKWEQVIDWRRQDTGVRLVDSTRVGRVREGMEQRAAKLANAGVDAINLHHSEWTGGLTALVHRFGVHCFGWDAQQPRTLDELLDLGIDAVYSDHVDRMVDALARLAA